jgi:aryl-phospho-beta-D-glucosidase BglC (GH1 family)
VSGQGPITWNIVSGQLPAGLSFDTTNGVISGTPFESGISSIIITAVNANGTSAPVTLILTVHEEPVTFGTTESGTVATSESPGIPTTSSESAIPTESGYVPTSESQGTTESSADITTTSPTESSTTASTTSTPPPVESVIFNMQVAESLERMANGGGNIPPLQGNGGTRVVNTASNPRTVTITARNNSSTGVDIVPANMTTRADHSYRFTVTGTLGTAAGLEARVRLVNSPNTVFVTDNTAAGGTFSMSFIRTHGEIIADAAAAQRYNIGGIENQTLVITGIIITEFHSGQEIITTTPSGGNVVIPPEPPIPSPAEATPNVIYNLQTDREPHVFGGPGYAVADQSIHHILKSNGGARTVNMISNPRTITITDRTGTSQGVDVRLSALNTRANHIYRFEFTARVSSGEGSQSVWLRTVEGNPATLASTNAAVNTSFTLTRNLSHDTIAALIAANPVQSIRLGGANQQDLIISAIVITAYCPAGCAGCAPRPPAKVPNGSFNNNRTATQIVADIGIGWNLGNTLDVFNSSDPGAITLGRQDLNNPSDLETRWISGRENRTTPELARAVRNAGFNAVRIPVTWYKAAGPAPTFTIDPRWMLHVKSIVDMFYAEDMYVILNTHHENFIIRPNERDAGVTAVTALWRQIAEEFKDYDEKLIFAGLNEPRVRVAPWTDGDAERTWDWTGDSSTRSSVNHFNQAFVNAVRATGGNNVNRSLMLPTYGAQARTDPLRDYRLPTEPAVSAHHGTSRFIMSVHIYSPHDWAHNNSGGSYPGVGRIQNDLNPIRDRARELGVPVILGEWGSRSEIAQASRVTHARDYVTTATGYGSGSNPVVMRAFVWDTTGGFNIINRQAPFVSANAQAIINAMLTGRGLPTR